MAKLLLVDDDKDLCDSVVDALSVEHHVVEVSYDGQSALDRLAISEYDLIILDLNLPIVSGMDVCRHLRSKRKTVPILMLTGRRSIGDRKEGLDSGADDYLTKPFDIRELLARIRSLLRRTSGQLSNSLHVRGLVMDPVKRILSKDGQDVYLQPTEFSLLEFLMRHPDQVFTHDALLNRVWTSESDATGEAIRSCIKRLRKKINDDDRTPIIVTVYGVGYKLSSSE